MKTTSRPTYVYIAKCRDGSYYTGVSINVDSRIKQHNSGRGAKYTLQRRPITLVYSEICESLSAALKREHQIKRWRRVQKEQLILASEASCPKRRRRTKSV